MTGNPAADVRASMKPVSLTVALFGVAGSPASERARRNLRDAMAANGIPDETLEFVDVLEHPERAYAERVLATPTAIIRTASGIRRIAGTLELSSLSAALTERGR